MTALNTRGVARAAALAAAAGALALAPATLAADPPLYGVGTNSNVASSTASATASPNVFVDVSNYITIDRAWEAQLSPGAKPPPHAVTQALRRKPKARAAHRARRHVAVRGKTRLSASARRR